MRAHTDYDFQKTLFDQCGKMMMTINQMPQPVIAVCMGWRLRQAANWWVRAIWRWRPKVQFSPHRAFGSGLFCSTPAVAVSRNLARKKAMEMLLTGEFIDAQTAMQQGLINYAVPADQLDATIQRLVDAITSKSHYAISSGKQMFYKQLEMHMAEAYAYAADIMACDMLAPDASEGIDAFIEKRHGGLERKIEIGRLGIGD